MDPKDIYSFTIISNCYQTMFSDFSFNSNHRSEGKIDRAKVQSCIDKISSSMTKVSTI